MLKRYALLLLAVPVQAMNVSMAGQFFELLRWGFSTPSHYAMPFESPCTEAEPYSIVQFERDGSVQVMSIDLAESEEAADLYEQEAVDDAEVEATQEEAQYAATDDEDELADVQAED